MRSRIDNQLNSLKTKQVQLLKIYLEELKEAKNDLYSNLDKQTIIAHELRPTTLKSYLRTGDKNMLTSIMILHYIRKDGTELDVQAKDISDQYFIEITEDDIVEFMHSNQSGKSSFHKFKELESVKHGIKKITGFNVTNTMIKLLYNRYSEQTELTLNAPF